MKIYIAGRISNYPRFQEHFSRVEKNLKEKGHIVLNPAVLPPGLTQEEYMRICIPMLDIAEFNAKIEGILSKNLDTTIVEIKESMALNDQNVTGQTANSLRRDVSANEGVIYGAEHFNTLEQGIRPGVFIHGQVLFQWGIAKNLFSASNTADLDFAWNISEKIREEGSLLYRLGGRENVYTDKVSILTERIMNEIVS